MYRTSLNNTRQIVRIETIRQYKNQIVAAVIVIVCMYMVKAILIIVKIKSCNSQLIVMMTFQKRMMSQCLLVHTRIV